ncbi:hypothetical protein CC86DRAFT_413824 [Ophiobolus disseminans]|uniref:DUF7907 domain-containing protein n=1 Tax=Ophiobolus disseminans TaxID=1469910 RepID=A0A6A6ZCC4_9PLEO|nr:hypothetical protein CC86DRAFT_413824 [Ophiobolus disseminans]
MNSITLALVALAATAAEAIFDIKSSAFCLVLRSGDTEIDGTVLGACHQGAMERSLCQTKLRLQDPAEPGTFFYHKVKSPYQPNANNIHGSVVFTLEGGNFQQDLLMKFQSPRDKNADLSISIFGGGQSFTAVNFDNDGKMHRWENGVQLYNWYICQIGYNYPGYPLSWKNGPGTELPQNPTCKKVEVVRVFVG